LTNIVKVCKHIHCINSPTW